MVSYAEDSIKVDHQYCKAHYMKGRGKYELSEYEEAIACFETIVEIDPNHGEGKKELARTIAKKK